MTALLTVSDSPAFDLLRGLAAGIASLLALACLMVLLLMFRRRHLAVVPRYVWQAPLGFLIFDGYAASREFQQIGHPLFLLGLPLALAGEVVCLLYLRDMWKHTRGLRERPTW